MKGAPTLKIRISDTKDPEVLLCTMRWGNWWSRAKLRKPGGWSGMDRVNLGLRTDRLARAIKDAQARGEVEVKDGPGKPWHKPDPEKETV